MKIKFNRIIAFIFVIFIAQHSFAQTPLTNRQIYDFNPGDVVQGTHFYKLDPGPPSYETFSYLKRTSSKNNDTLFYKIRREYYTPPACQDCKPLVWIDTITQAYMELDSIAKHYNETFQYSIKDTFYNDFCNRRVWAKKPDKLDSVWFEPTKHYTYYVEGLGGPFYKKEFSQGGPTTLDFVLTYYKKDGISCGNFVNDVHDFKAHNLKATIFPNPLNEKATIHFEKPLLNGHIVLFNFEGQIIRELNSIKGNDIEFLRKNLLSGIYFLHVEDNGKSSSQKVILQ
jgi:hypothetical protein